MLITTRPYQHPNDFARLSYFLSLLRPDAPHTYVLHPGDLTWQLFHMLAEYPPASLVQLWEDLSGTIIGFVLLFPRFGGFALQIHPTHRGSALEAEMMQWAEQHLSSNPRNSTLVNTNDTFRVKLLIERGYHAAGDWLYLDQTLPPSRPVLRLPSGFVVRAVKDEQEVGLRATVLAAAFEAPPLIEQYRQFMRAPGYNRDLDLVAVSPDGQFAAFAMCWVDPESRVGQFEPVGTAPEFRRKGLARAVLEEGLHRMRAHGSEHAIVIVEAEEQAACRLYEAVGFEVRWALQWYVRTNMITP